MMPMAGKFSLAALVLSFIRYSSELCPDINIDISGNSTLCPDEVIGLYQCTITNGEALRWIVNGERLPVFSGIREVGRRETLSGTTITAYLVEVERVIESGVRGNRTSILHYEADFDNSGPITIECDEGLAPTCTMDVMVVADEIEPPNAPTGTGTDAISYTWTHDRSSSVDYYSLAIGGDMLENQTVHLNVSQFVLPPNQNLFELRAISKCGRHSAPRFVQGVNGGPGSVPTDVSVSTTEMNVITPTMKIACDQVGPGVGGLFAGLFAGLFVGALGIVLVMGFWYRDKKRSKAMTVQHMEVGDVTKTITLF